MISDYKQSVIDLASKKVDVEFENKGAIHAAIVLSAMMQSSQRTICMYSGNLNEAVTKDKEFLNVLNEVLQDKNRTFKLLIDELPNVDKQSEALKAVIKASENSHVIAKVLDGKDESLKNLGHFIIIDKMSYRYETNAKEFKALCNFNDKEIALKLLNIFNIAYEKAKYLGL